MLSIGKVGMSAGQQMYYEQQVAKGADDYYAGKGEAPGRWTGRGAGLLGLSGGLDAERLKAMMDGRHPLTEERLANRSGNCSTAAVEMTFSAPKSVSVLFAVGDEELSRALVAAHEEAVDAAVAYIEREACRVRRGHNGTKAERERGDPRGWERARSEPAGGFVAAAYRHRMSRAQDPQLHTHVVAANMARGADGRWTALDAKHIYEHAKAGGSVYQAHLRAAVRERLPWAVWGPVRNGMAELEQVPAEVIGELSTRRRRILEREQELVAAGVAVGDLGRERIAYDTRETKREVNESDWRREVQARAAEHGLGQAELERIAALPAQPPAQQLSEPDLAGQLLGPAGLTAMANTFGERDVVVSVAAAARQGLRAEEVVGLSGRLIGSPEVVAVAAGSARRFMTRELLAAEHAIVTAAMEGRGRGVAVVGEGDALSALSRHGRLLSVEQERVVLGVAGSGNALDLERKRTRDELTAFIGPQAAVDAEHAAIDRWTHARGAYGDDQAVLICRDNHRRERLNELARQRLKVEGELGEAVEVAGREWCVGERVIARRNERRRDVDNGTHGTVVAVDASNGLRVRTDSGQVRQIDPEYASGHLDYAYALTGHRMQGATVEWAGVIGTPADFTRNWSYTALSRAREPGEIFLVDDLSQLQHDRAEIAPGVDRDDRPGPVERMAERMRERDDEDLAIEQLPPTRQARSPSRPSRVSSTRPDA